jgi:hypothetical protein
LTRPDRGLMIDRRTQPGRELIENSPGGSHTRADQRRFGARPQLIRG